MRSLHSHWDKAVGRDQVYPKWAYFIVGTGLLVLGALGVANLFIDAAPPVRFIGAMVALGAVAQLLHAMLVTGWSGFYAWLFSGALYGAAGIIAFYDPLLASLPLTIGLLLALSVAGLLRVRTRPRLRPEAGWRWLALSGGLTIVAGVVIAIGWPIDHAVLLATVLAADLIAQGIAAVAFGAAIKSKS
ncbi:HdeD family acid-resistance protein [Microvirga sp. M2]|uniref:HdeD family acid-resistance protein n=1 Tax=Microvirga sp. M2 TaxID=3073270 RepID=UPI0039C31FE7